MDISELISDGSTDLNKQDILQLLSTGLKENQSFAKWFADTILVDIQRKLKDIKIQSTAIEIDGKSISKNINDNIREGLEKDIDKTVETIRKEVKTAGSDISKSADKNPLSLGSLLGQTPSISKATAKKYDSLTKALLDKITKAVPTAEFKFKDIGLGEIFSPLGDSSATITAAKSKSKKWDTLQNTLMDKLNGGIPSKFKFNNISIGEIFRPPGDNNFLSFSNTKYKKWNSFQNILMDKLIIGLPEKFSFENISIGEIFRPPGEKGNFLSMSLGRLMKWNKLQNSIMDRISTILPKAKFDFEDIAINDIMGVTPKTGLWTRMKWADLQHKILKSVKAGVPEKMNLGGELTINDIMGATPKMGLWTRLQWGSLQRKILSKAKEAVDKGEGGGMGKALGGMLAGEDDKSKETEAKPKSKKSAFKSLEEKAMPIELAILSKGALDQFAKLIHGKDAIAPTMKDEKPPSGLMKWMAPILTILGGLGALAMGLMSNGPAKGLLTMIGKGGLMVGLKMLAKTVGGVLLKTLKWIPFVGTLVDFADAFVRFKSKDFVGGTIALVGGLLSLVNLVAPGVGTALSLGASALNAFLDYKAGGAGEGKNVKKLDILGSMAKTVGRFLLKIVRHLPIIGTAIQLYESYKAFKSGDIGGGILALGGGLATMIPGGMFISAGIGFLASMIEKKAAAASAEGKPTSKMDIITGFIKPIKDKIVNWFKNTLLFKIGSGVFNIFKGNIVEGFGQVASAMSGIPIIGPVVTTLNSWLNAANENVKSSQTGAKPISLFQALKNVIYDKIKKGMKFIPGPIRAAMRFIPGLKDLLGAPDAEEVESGSPVKTMPLAQKNKNEAKDVAQDFVWRKGQKAQKFSERDNIIAVKDSKKFDQMLGVLNGSAQNGDKMVQQIGILHTDINRLVIKMNSVADVLAAGVNASAKKQANASPVLGDLSGISEDAGSVRDPAYVLRSRAWDRIRKGYVVV